MLLHLSIVEQLPTPVDWSLPRTYGEKLLKKVKDFIKVPTPLTLVGNCYQNSETVHKKILDMDATLLKVPVPPTITAPGPGVKLLLVCKDGVYPGTFFKEGDRMYSYHCDGMVEEWTEDQKVDMCVYAALYSLNVFDFGKKKKP